MGPRRGLGAWLVAGAVTLEAVVGTAVVAHAQEQRKNFVSCPIVRDTASVPCWLTEHEGELYFLTVQSDVTSPVTPPWLGHKVLVEGVVSSEPRICGGIVLKPVRLSVLPARDASCNTILPAEERYNLTFEPPRPPGPSKGRLAFDYVPPPPPSPPSESEKSFTVQYDFDGLVAFNHARVLSEVLDFARKSNAKAIEVLGYRGSVRLSNGQLMTEEGDIGQRRAEQVATLLKGASLTAPTYTVRWQDETAKATGRDDHVTRRVIITVRR